MIVLKWLKELSGGVFSLKLQVESDILSLTVFARDYMSAGAPTVGCELSREAYDELVLSNESYRAEKKALSLLSYADNNRKTLERKLVMAGFRRETAKDVTEQMMRLGYINEEKQLEGLILRESNQMLSGPGKLIPKLCAKGFDLPDIKRVLNGLVTTGEIDLEENARKLLEKKLGQNFDEEEKRKLLYKYGYKTFSP